MTVISGEKVEVVDVREYIKQNILVFDGAMGTMLQKRGLKKGALPEVLNIEDRDIIIDIHKISTGRS